jgi:hypothetical protein
MAEAHAHKAKRAFLGRTFFLSILGMSALLLSARSAYALAFPNLSNIFNKSIFGIQISTVLIVGIFCLLLWWMVKLGNSPGGLPSIGGALSGAANLGIGAAAGGIGLGAKGLGRIRDGLGGLFGRIGESFRRRKELQTNDERLTSDGFAKENALLNDDKTLEKGSEVIGGEVEGIANQLESGQLKGPDATQKFQSEVGQAEQGIAKMEEYEEKSIAETGALKDELSEEESIGKEELRQVGSEKQDDRRITQVVEDKDVRQLAKTDTEVAQARVEIEKGSDRQNQLTEAERSTLKGIQGSVQNEKKLVSGLQQRQKAEFGFLKKARENLRKLKSLKFKDGREAVDSLRQIDSGLKKFSQAKKLDEEAAEAMENIEKQKHTSEMVVKGEEAEKATLFNRMGAWSNALLAKLRTAPPSQLRMK